ncbi:hypothetical protein PFISCL1PPCAC_8932, partial [Pristionchus fissidentatus]
VRALTLMVSGSARTRITEGSGSPIFTALVRYINIEQTLWTPEGARAAKGKHTFTYSFSIPSNSPSSLRHEYGAIQYYCKAVVHRDGWMWNATHTMFFKVARFLDLNSIPDAQLPAIVHSNPQLDAWWSGSPKGPVSIRVHVDTSVFFGVSASIDVPVYIGTVPLKAAQSLIRKESISTCNSFYDSGMSSAGTLCDSQSTLADN